MTSVRPTIGSDIRHPGVRRRGFMRFLPALVIAVSAILAVTTYVVRDSRADLESPPAADKPNFSSPEYMTTVGGGVVDYLDGTPSEFIECKAEAMVSVEDGRVAQVLTGANNVTAARVGESVVLPRLDEVRPGFEAQIIPAPDYSRVIVYRDGDGLLHTGCSPDSPRYSGGELLP